MLTEERMQQLCENWREALNLKDWDIELRVVTPDQLKKGDMGACDMVITKKRAVIEVLGAEYFPALRAAGAKLGEDEFEQERCIVHELCHIHYAAIDSLIGYGSVAEVILEQAISSVDHLLVELAQAARGPATMAA